MLTRDVFGPDATLGVLDVDLDRGMGWQSFGFTVEDEDRGLRQTMPEVEIARIKIRAETAIPTGRYDVRFTRSPKYAGFMRSFGRTDGKMPEVLHVPGFRGIRIHPGNDERDTAGCVLPGLSRDASTMTVARSRVACTWLYGRIADCEARGEDVVIIVRDGREAE